MKNLSKILLLGLGCLLVCTKDIHANYLPLFLERNEGMDLEKKQDYLKALVRFKVDLEVLEKIHERNPDWVSDLVLKSTADYREKIARLEPLATQQFLAKQKAQSPLSSGPYFNLLYDEGLKEPDNWKAMNEIEEYLTTLEIIQQIDPQWENERIEDRIKKSKLQMERLEILAIKAENEKPYDGLPIQ